MTDQSDALETSITVECPICLVDLPAPHKEEPTPEGLSVTFDHQFVEEHIDMHKKCTCRWAHSDSVTVRRITNLSCEVHA